MYHLAIMEIFETHGFTGKEKWDKESLHTYYRNGQKTLQKRKEKFLWTKGELTLVPARGDRLGRSEKQRRGIRHSAFQLWLAQPKPGG